MSTTIPSAYTTGLTASTLDELYGDLEVLEGFGEGDLPGGQTNRDGLVYYDYNGIPTIGYGFNITDANSRNAVLDDLRDQDGNKVFQAASAKAIAAHKSIISASQIVDYFKWIIGKSTSPIVLIFKKT